MNVICGICDKSVPVPCDRKVKGRIIYFKKYHFNRLACNYKTVLRIQIRTDSNYFTGSKLKTLIPIQPLDFIYRTVTVYENYLVSA